MTAEFSQFNSYEFDRLILAERANGNVDYIDIWSPPQTPERHGTDYAYRRHSFRGEQPCEACRLFHNAKQRKGREQRKLRGPKPRPPLKPCGSMAAVRRHQRKKEPLCILCRFARQRFDKERDGKRWTT